MLRPTGPFPSGRLTHALLSDDLISKTFPPHEGQALSLTGSPTQIVWLMA